jgi:opacity protein-like surface antigen
MNAGRIRAARAASNSIGKTSRSTSRHGTVSVRSKRSFPKFEIADEDGIEDGLRADLRRAGNQIQDCVGAGHVWVNRRPRPRAILALYLASSALFGWPIVPWSPAWGADLPLPNSFAGIPSVGAGWDGFYVGAHVGYTLGSSSFTSNAPNFPSAEVAGVNAQDGQFGPLGAGLQGGYRYVTPSGVMFGVEATLSFPDQMNGNPSTAVSALQTSSIADEVDIFGALSGRLGYAFGSWLFYGIGGFAYDRDLATGVDTNGQAQSSYFWRRGWLAGAGVEAALDRNWSARLEYSHYGFGRADMGLPSSVTLTDRTSPWTPCNSASITGFPIRTCGFRQIPAVSSILRIGASTANRPSSG